MGVYSKWRWRTSRTEPVEQNHMTYVYSPGKHILEEKGVEAWNMWRAKRGSRSHRGSADNNLSRLNLPKADLSGGDFYNTLLPQANLLWADLCRANLERADLRWANLSGAYLSGANLERANLGGANLSEARLYRADLTGANLGGANLTGANLSRANVRGADLYEADLRRANLTGANLSLANLPEADLSEADLSGANLTRSILVKTSLERTTLVDCRVYGISAWSLRLEGAKQWNLIITEEGEPDITVDNLEVAQFVYLLLNNEKLRQVIDAVTSKAVLILGRFTAERKAILDAIRNALRQRGYLPILFDFKKPASRDLTETISTLAHMTRFMVADITEAKSIPQELQAIVPNLPSVPVQPLLLSSEREYGMFEHFKRYPWVLETYYYDDPNEILVSLEDKIINPAEDKASQLSR